MTQASSTMPPGDDLDQLLGAFFRSEMPDPWPGFQPSLSQTAPLKAAPLPGTDPRQEAVRPALDGVLVGPPLPTEEPARSQPLSSVSRSPGSARANWSRLALAVALLVLLGGLWALGGSAVPEQGTPPSFKIQPGRAEPIPIPLPETSPEVPEKNVKSSISLEQGADGRTGFRIDVREEAPPPER
jgi:hypothetical protein